jgi:uncharacterized repeat protein (TIGR02543 family)
MTALARLVARRHWRIVRLFLSVLLVVSGGLVVLAIAGTPVSANVTTWYAAVGGSGTSCTTGSPCTLTEALSEATTGDTIDLAAGTYQPASGTSFTIAISLTIQPTTTGTTVILKGNGSTVLLVNSSVAATISEMTIEGGTGPSGGGGIDNNGTLTVENSTISGNTATYGGGIENDGTATIEDSTIPGNSGAVYGGGIDNNGPLTIEDSTISGNSTSSSGGGIQNDGTLTVEASTISGNTASNYGGGIWNNGTLTVGDSTIAGNTAGSQGGGIINYSGPATIEASTFSGNSASVGGGIHNIYGTTILAADILTGPHAGGNCSIYASWAGPIQDAGYNIDDDGSCGLTATGSVSDSQVIDNYLGTLGANGGPTATVPLLAVPSPTTASADPAIGLIPSSFNLPVVVNGVLAACSVPDQRGVSRDQPCDIGAFNTNAFAVTYNYEAGTGTPATATFTVGGSALNLPTPTRTGYSFTGWYTAPSGGTLVGVGGAAYSPAGSLTLYAQWTAPLLITASSDSMTYGGTVPTVTPSYTGLVNGDTAPATLPVCSTLATGSSTVGTYKASCGGAADPNYTISYANGVTTVNPAKLVVTASSGSLTYGGTPPTITPAYSGFVNGDSAASLTTPAVCGTVGITYVANILANSVTEYAVGADGNSSPIRTISGSSTQLNSPVGLAMDAAGTTLYVANSGDDTITEYGAGTSGNVTPIQAIGGSLTGLSGATGVALDSAGTLYVTNATSNSVTEYSPGANGNAAPSRTISGYSTGLSGPRGVALDANDVLYVTNANAYSVTEYSAGASGNVAPVRTISGGNTGLGYPTSIQIDPNGNLYVANPQEGYWSITEYGPGTNGNVAPARSFSGGVFPYFVALDAAGTAYVANNSNQSILEFGAGASGGVAPIRTITGSLTGLSGPFGIVVSPVTNSAPVGTYGSGCSGASDPNYTISYVAGTVSVTPAPLLITASSDSMTYGGTVPTVTPSYTGLVNGDTAPATLPVCSTLATGSSTVGTYKASCGGAADPNYTITYANGVTTVDPAKLVVTASSGAITYGGTPPTITPAYAGFVNGDSATSLTTQAVCGTVGITYVANISANSVTEYAVGADGNAAPIRTISGSNTQLNSPYGLAMDAAGTLYVANSAANSTITEFGAGSSGNVAPIRTISGSLTGLSGATGVTLGSAGTLYVTNASNNSITEYSPGASGNATPTRVISGYSTGLSAPRGVALDANNVLYVTNANAYSVTEYSAGASGNVAPVRSISGGNTGLGYPTSVAIDPNGNLYVANPQDGYWSITEYAPGTNGNVAPARSFSGGVFPYFVALDAAGTAYVANNSSQSILEFGAGASGGVAPIRTITGSLTGLSGPFGIVVSPVSSSTPVGTYGSGCGGASDPNYTISYVAGTVSVTPAALTITASSDAMTYGGAVPTITPVYSGLVNGDTTLATPPICSTFASSGSGVGGYTASCIGASDPNYAITYANGVTSVDPAKLVVTASSDSMTYGGTVPTITPAYTGLVNVDSAPAILPNCSTLATSISSVGTYNSSCKGAADPNYTISYVTGVTSVGTAPLLITASSDSMNYGGTEPTITPIYTGLTNGDTAPATAPFCSTEADKSSGVGLYTSNCAGASDPNYSISYGSGVTTVGPAPLLITASSDGMSYGGAVPVVSPVYSGLQNAATRTAILPNCTTLATSGSPVGQYLATCWGAADPNYAISYAGGLTTVGPAKLLVTASTDGMVFGGTVPVITPSYTGLENGDTVPAILPTCSTLASSEAAVGTYDSSCTGASDANYTISYATGVTTVAPAGMTVTASSDTMTYGGAVPTITAVFDSKVGGDNSLTHGLAAPTCVTAATSASTVGGYASTCTGAATTPDGNYAVSYVAGVTTVGPAALLITASSATMTYGGVVPGVSALYFGLENGDTVPAILPTCSTLAKSSSAVGSYISSCTGAADPNYTISYQTGKVTVGTAGLTITASSGSMVYGAAGPSITPSYAGFVGGDTAAKLTALPTCNTSAGPTSTVLGGPYPSSCTGAVDGNYTISYDGGTVVVQPASLQITASTGTMVAGKTVPLITPAFSGFQGSDSGSSLTTQPVCSTLATKSSPVGVYASTCLGAQDGNYTISYIPGTITVIANAYPTIGSVTPAGGPVTGNQTVKVSGSGFVSGMTVTIGGTKVVPSAVTSTSFSFTTPPKPAGLDQVQVTTAVGSSLLSVNDGYIYSVLGSYFALAPTRVLDTRSSSCIQCGGGALGPGATRTLQITGVTGLRGGADPVPANATAVVLNVTAVAGTGSSSLTVYANGTGRPITTNLNFTPGKVVATLMTVTLGMSTVSDAQREVNIYNQAGTVNVVVDVEGYFGPQTSSNPTGEFHSIAPLRVCDTRVGSGITINGCNQGQGSSNLLGPGKVVKVNVTGKPAGISGSPATIPSDGTAGSVVLNLTVVAPTVATYVSVYPPQSNGTCAVGNGSSNLNVLPGAVQTNRVIVPMGPASSGGHSTDVCVFNAAGKVNFILDASGWFGSTLGSAPIGSQFQAIGPVRVCDTRSGTGTLCSGFAIGSGGTLTVAVAGIGGIPSSGPTAFIGNLTAIGGSASTYLLAYPADVSPRPNGSDLNPPPGAVLSNMVAVGLSKATPAGEVKLFNAAGSINAVLDVDGWFQ